MNEEFFALLIARYEQAELLLLEKLNKYLIDGSAEDIDQTWVYRKLANVKALKRDAIQIVNELALLDTGAREQLIKAFLAGAYGNPGTDFLGSNGAALNALLTEYLGQLEQARFQILRQSLDAYRAIVGTQVQQVALGLTPRLKTARNALQAFASRGITGFVSRDGRQWEIASYTEMATRTASLNAFREGRIASITTDLIIISSVPNPSDLCKPYERRILSISGSDKRYTSLAQAKANGLFHPNCRHSFTKYVPGLTSAGITDADRGFDDYEATQEQRYAERQIRKYKRILAIDPENAQAKAKISEYRARIRNLTEEYDLVRKRNRESNVQAR